LGVGTLARVWALARVGTLARVWALVEVGVLEVRVAESDADLEAWRAVFRVVVPAERSPTVEQMRASARRDLVRVLAVRDGEVVGSGTAGHSDMIGAASLAPRVLPTARRQGVGTELLRVLGRHAASLGVDVVQANVEDVGSLAFAARFGFREIDRQIEQVRTIAAEPVPAVPEGVTIVSVAEQPWTWPAAYEVVGEQAFQDMALVTPIHATRQEWETDWIGDPAAMFVALADGEVIGCAGLIGDDDEPHRAENALTAVRRDWRGRGVASALKRVTLAWAAAHGLTEVYTWTQVGNADMIRLNNHLGYVNRTESVTVRAALPLAV
jgi:GNAT superfamily N-acetyltransferase